jgi:signal transduction histidine kinase
MKMCLGTRLRRPLTTPHRSRLSGRLRHPTAVPQQRLEAWERREGPVLAALPYALLAVCTIFTIAARPDGTGELPVVVALSLATAAWMAWWVGLHRGRRCRPPALVGIYFTGLVALMFALVLLAPWYGFFTWTGYLSVILLPDRFKPLGVLAVAAVTGTSQNGGLPSGDLGAIGIYVLILAINTTAAGVIMFFAWVGDAQKTRQTQLVAELTEVNQRLERSLEENAGLHRQLLAQAREAGVLDERQRMARELHDTLAQGLAGIITQLEAVEQAGNERAGDARRHLDAARRLARESLSAARRSVHAMRPEQLEAARLPEALTGEAQRWSALHGVRADVTTTGAARPLRPEIEVTLLRAAQEALANVSKHAHAGRVGLTLSYMDDLVTLDVRDDGVGFVPNGNVTERRDGGFGLLGMRQRVQGLAGTLQIESEPGSGTALSVSIPAVPAETPA